jgi:hypothetical protein
MKPWHILGGFTLLILLIAAWRIHSYEKERNAPVAIRSTDAERPLTDDQMVTPKKMFIDSLESAKALDGKPVWMQVGYTIAYYPYRAKHIDFAHSAGTLPAAQQLDVKDVVEATAPASWQSRIPRGPKNAFVIFTQLAQPGEYAAPIATLAGPDATTWYCDEIFFYQDPRQLYHFWPTEIWQAIDQHQAKPGMNEIQASMALGNAQQSDSTEYGNRTVIYTIDESGKTDQPGKTRHVAVTFRNGRATEVKES